MKRLTLLAALVLASSSLAESVPPALFVRVQPGDKKLQQLRLSKLKVEARILGFIAETKMTMTFHNPHNRVLEGDLYFPLPEGSTVSGYALDIKGTLVDGVVVGKTKGRQVYEKIVRQGIDPGLVEWVKGSNFKTRVFPIPARGTRTIRVDTVADIVEKDGAGTYRLPLSFAQPIDQFALRVEVVKATAAPKVAGGGPKGLSFGKFRDSFVAETAVENARLDEDLVVALPDTAKQKVLMEKAPDGKVYFCINDAPADPRREKQAPQKPKHIAVLWDASASRAKADHQRELGILAQYIASLGKQRTRVDLILFRNVAEAPRTFHLDGDAAPLVAALQQVKYDGGTQIGSLVWPLNVKPALALLFTDGISNFGKEQPALPCPVYVLNGQSTANHSFLRYVAMQTGGEYFNLSRLDDAQVVPAIGRSAFSFLRAQAKGGRELYPRLAQPVHGRFALVGQMAGDETAVKIEYGSGGKTLATTRLLLDTAQAAEGDLLRRFWAQRKVDDLNVFPKRNEKEITRVGKQCGIVTPHTSLIVLDSLEQYVEHGIAPPKSLPKMRAQFEDIIEKRRAAEQKKQQDKLQQVIAMWSARVKWWETEFKYPPNFRYQQKAKQGEGRAVGGAGAPARTRGAAPRPAAMPAIAAPEPREAAEAEVADDAAPGNDLAVKRGGKGKPASASAPAIAIKAWDPKTPYLDALKKAKPGERFAVYLKQRAEYGTSPAFYLDCADHLLKQKQDALAMQVLSNVAELELENAALVRVLAHKLAQLGRLELATYLFEEALRLRPEEPQSYRDLALVLARRADAIRTKNARRRSQEQAERDRQQAKTLYERALGLLAQVVMGHWDRFREVEVIALMEFNAIAPKAKTVGVTKLPLDPRLVKLLGCDVRIVMTWDADSTDMDLHVLEPSGEEAYYGHRRTVIGGNNSRDFTRGYGPEEYCLRKAMRGMYTIKTRYYGSAAAKLIGAVTLQVDVFTNYGRPDEQRKSITLRLAGKKETFTVGQIEF